MPSYRPRSPLFRHLVATLGLLAAAASANAAVFVNELHYDNASTDSGEAIELAGTAGTSLDGWSIVLYNGSTGASYDTTTLTGVILDQQNSHDVKKTSLSWDTAAFAPDRICSEGGWSASCTCSKEPQPTRTRRALSYPFR